MLRASRVGVPRFVSIFYPLCTLPMDVPRSIAIVCLRAPPYGTNATILGNAWPLTPQTMQCPSILPHPGSTALVGKRRDGSGNSFSDWLPSLLKISFLLSRSGTIRRCVGCKRFLGRHPLALMLWSCTWEPTGCRCFQSPSQILIFGPPPIAPTATSACPDK